MQRVQKSQVVTGNCQVPLVDLGKRRIKSLMDAQRVVGVIDPERRLHDRQVDVELDSGGVAKFEVRTRRDCQLPLLVSQREIVIDIIYASLIQSKRASVQDAIGSKIREEGHADGPSDRDTVFQITDTLNVASGKSDGVDERAYRKRNTRIGNTHALIHHTGNIGHRGNRANVESAEIVFSAHVAAAV